MKMIGDCVAATALRAPPPLAWPSNFVTITLPTSTLDWGLVSAAKRILFYWQDNLLLESSCLPLTSLPNGGVHDKNNVVWINGVADLHNFWYDISVVGEERIITASISSKSESSCLCLPDVSTIMISKPCKSITIVTFMIELSTSSLNISTPSLAITTGSTWIENKSFRIFCFKLQYTPLCRTHKKGFLLWLHFASIGRKRQP